MEKDTMGNVQDASAVEDDDTGDEVTKVLSMYKNIKSQLDQESHLDYIAAVLASGMLLDLKGEEEKPVNLATLVRRLKARVSKLSDGEVTRNDISVAKLVASYIALSPKLEEPEEVVRMWDLLRKEIKLEDDLDFIVALLISSRIHGLDTPDKLTEVENVLKMLME